MHECQDCHHKYALDGELGPANAGCPNCGSYRSQPTPINSEMGLRNMPMNGMDDMGGNPLQEGVWAGIDGGWQNRMKRDESFAKVGATQVVPTGGQRPGYHLLTQSTLGEIENSKPGLMLSIENGQPMPLEQANQQIPYGHTGPITVSHPHPKVEQIASQVISDGHGKVWQDLQAAAAERKRQRLEQQQGLQPPQASRHVAEDFDDDDLFGDDVEIPNAGIPNPSEYINQERPFVIDQEGNHYGDPQNPDIQWHEDLAQLHGNEPAMANFPKGLTLGYSNPDQRNLRVLQNESGHSPEQLGQILQQAYPDHELPEDMSAVSNEQRWGLENAHEGPVQEQWMPGFDQRKQQEQQGVAERGQKYRYNENPWFNRGGHVQDDRNSIYLPWNYDTSRLAGDFEVVQVVEDGPHTVETQDGVVMQHEDADALEVARQKVEAGRKVAFLPLLALMGAGGALLGEGGAAAAGGVLARGVAGGLISNAVGQGVGGATQTAPEPTAVQGMPEVPEQYLSAHEEIRAIQATYDHPSTDKLVERASGDPDDVDPEEFNDGEHGMGREDISGGGTDALRPEVVQAIEEAMPNLLQYYHSEESGENDPAIQKLLQTLQQYDPELLNEPVSAEAQAALDSHMPKIAMMPMGPGMMPAGGQPAVGQPQPAVGQPQAPVSPTTQGSCPHCGAMIQPGAALCAQCNGALMAPQAPDPAAQGFQTPGTTPAPTQQMGVLASDGYDYGYPVEGTPWCSYCGGVGRDYKGRAQRGGNELDVPPCPQCTGSGLEPQADLAFLPETQHPLGREAANQGPHSIEQVQAVADLLEQTGRHDEIPNLVTHPEMYGDELAQIAGRQQPPTPDPDPGAPPPAPDPSQMGMPPGAMPQGGGGGMPPMMGKVGADHIAPSCPKCGTHTTETLDSDIDPGNFNCHRCGHTWKEEGVFPTKHGADVPTDHPVIEGAPAADQTSPDDPSQDVNPGIWQTTDGQPLVVGKQYEMYSDKYDVPDLVKITALKPDGLEYTLQGEYGLAHRTAVSKLEAEMDGLQFIPLEQGDVQPDADTDDTAAQADWPQQTDLSGAVLSRTADMSPEELKLQSDPGQGRGPIMTCPNCQASMRPSLGSCPHCGMILSQMSLQAARTAGKKYTPMEQRDFIDEGGKARNSDKLDLAGTHYEEPSLSDDHFLLGW